MEIQHVANNRADNVLDEKFKLLYSKSEFIYGAKTGYGRRVLLQNSEMFDTQSAKRIFDEERSILSIDFNAFSLENNAARTLRHRLPKHTNINKCAHDCMCFHICNDDFDDVAAMAEKDN